MAITSGGAMAQARAENTTERVTSAMAEGLPDALKPKAIGGFGWNVADLEAQKAWYVNNLGMRVLREIRKDGKLFEYILGYENSNQAVLALHVAPRPNGAHETGRLILSVADSKGLADYLQRKGIENRMINPRIFVIRDPEGNPVELYTPPTPAAR